MNLVLSRPAFSGSKAVVPSKSQLIWDNVHMGDHRLPTIVLRRAPFGEGVLAFTLTFKVYKANLFHLTTSHTPHHYFSLSTHEFGALTTGVLRGLELGPEHSYPQVAADLGHCAYGRPQTAHHRFRECTVR